MKIRQIIFALLAVMVAVPSYGQKITSPFEAPCRSDFTASLRLGGGEHMSDGCIEHETEWGFNTGLDFGYAYFFHSNWGIRTGLNIVRSASGFSSDSVESEMIGMVNAYDDDQTYQYSSHLTIVTAWMEEWYKLLMIEVPIQAAFRYKNFFANVGIKALIPISYRSHYDYGNSTLGYGRAIDDLGIRLDDPIPTESVAGISGDYHMKDVWNVSPVWVAFSLEAGYHIPVDKLKMISVGVFSDFSLMSTRSMDDGSLKEAENGAPILSGGMFSNQIKSLRYFSVGMKLIFDIDFR